MNLYFLIEFQNNMPESEIMFPLNRKSKPEDCIFTHSTLECRKLCIRAKDHRLCFIIWYRFINFRHNWIYNYLKWLCTSLLTKHHMFWYFVLKHWSIITPGQGGAVKQTNIKKGLLNNLKKKKYRKLTIGVLICAVIWGNPAYWGTKRPGSDQTPRVLILGKPGLWMNKNTRLR